MKALIYFPIAPHSYIAYFKIKSRKNTKPSSIARITALLENVAPEITSTVVASICGFAACPGTSPVSEASAIA